MRGAGVEGSAQEAFPLPCPPSAPGWFPGLQLRRSRKAWPSSSRTTRCKGGTDFAAGAWSLEPGETQRWGVCSAGVFPAPQYFLLR